ncbi:hypothetical protein M0R45_038139 [Rubus argutus]|uniref:Uncharacterized protein n=1 Tax=Rubus argutus TaxID=59490 RepID=A0AAW1W2D8_RUBAR
MREPELGEKRGDDGCNIGLVGVGNEEASGEGEGFEDGEEGEACIVLGDVGGDFAERGSVEGGGVEEERAACGGGSGG